MNQKLTALNKLLVDENELASKKIAELTMENSILRQQMMSVDSSSKMGLVLPSSDQVRNLDILPNAFFAPHITVCVTFRHSDGR